MESSRKSDVFIVAPRLYSPEGHEFEHAQEFARAIKARDPNHKVIVLSGPQNQLLTEMLHNQNEIDQADACFQRRWLLWDGSSARELIQSSILDGLALWRALRQFGKNRPILFFDALDIHRLLVLVVIRCLAPWRSIKAVGIMRNDPLDSRGDLKNKYGFLRNSLVGRLVASLAFRGTLVFTDSTVLREVLRTKLQIHADMLPIPVPGIWQFPDIEIRPRQDQRTTVAFIGQPRPARGFDLFVSTALAMEKERRIGELLFLIVTPPGGLETQGMKRYRSILEWGLTGIAFEERWMNSVQFAQQINRADIIWALCDPPDYYLRQTSGIFTHGFCLGKRLIANRGGWAESVVGSLPVCRYVEPRLDQTVEAMLSLASVRPDAECLDRAKQWRASHSREAFDDFVARALSRIEDGVGTLSR